MSILAGTATGNLIAQWVPVKDGMSSSRLFLILIRIKFTDLTDAQTEACHQARNGSEQCWLPLLSPWPLLSPKHHL